MSSRKHSTPKGGSGQRVVARLLLTLVAYLGLQVVLRYAGAVRGPVVEALGQWGLMGQEARFFGSVAATVLMAVVVALYIIASRTKVGGGAKISAKKALGDYAKGAAVSLVMIGAVVALSVLGGGVSHAGDALLLPLRERVKKSIYSKNAKINTRIELAKLHNDAGVLGAALLG